MNTREIMTSKLDVVTARDSVTRAAQVMLTSDIGFVPVVDDIARMRLVGVLTDRDIAMRYVAQNRSPNTLVGDIMTSEHLVCVRPEDDAHDVLGRMRHERVRRIPVVDKEHRVIGVVAQADIARKLGPREPNLVEKMLEDISQPAPA
jgi:CBS domain-containing protein